MRSFYIGRAAGQDIPQLVALLGELFSIEQDFTPDSGRQAAGLGRLLERPDAAVFVARDSRGEPVGMVSAQLVVSTAQGALSAWIEDAIVAGNCRGQGVGRMLLGEALRWARERGATRAQLLVDQGNSPAQDFYAKLGWQPTHLVAHRMFLEAE